VIGIGEQHLSATLQKVFPALGSDGRMRTHRHEGRRQNLVVTGCKARGARTRAGGRGFQCEVQPTQGGVPMGGLCGARFLYATWWVCLEKHGSL